MSILVLIRIIVQYVSKSNYYDILSITGKNKHKNCSYRQNLNRLTYEKLCNQVTEIEDHEIKYTLIIM